jgi:N6-L-threonylcarbamoyladenine synthase
MDDDFYILGIESSCDDTSVAITNKNHVLSNIISSQLVHNQYGGVVPEIASREHMKNIVPVLNKALEESKIDLNEIDLIAYTNGPGLSGSLIVGSSFAKSLAQTLSIPMTDVDHMKAHIHSIFLKNEGNRYPRFPFLSLTVSGGHTQLVIVNDYNDFKKIGNTLDDAAGEAFDKTSKFLGLGYPGGPIIDNLSKKGNPIFKFSKPKIKDYDFSFSGLKTSIIYFIKKELKENSKFIEDNINDLCSSIQHSIVEILVEKTIKCAIDLNIKQICIVGGVSANSHLREKLNSECLINKFDLFYPKINYCTDNAAMIAVSGYFNHLNKKFSDLDKVIDSRLSF